MAALIATHNLELGARMDRVVRLDKGRLREVPLERPEAEEDSESQGQDEEDG